MRYVVIIAAIMFFFIWDGASNNGRYLDQTMRFLNSIVDMVRT